MVSKQRILEYYLPTYILFTKKCFSVVTLYRVDNIFNNEHFNHLKACS